MTSPGSTQAHSTLGPVPILPCLRTFWCSSTCTFMSLDLMFFVPAMAVLATSCPFVPEDSTQAHLLRKLSV